MSISLVQTKTGGQSVTITLTAGNSLVGFSLAHGSSNWPNMFSVSDGTNTYAIGGQYHDNTTGGVAQSFYALSVAGGSTTLDASWSGNGSGVITYDYMIVAEFSGVSGVDANTTGSFNNVSSVPVGELICIFTGEDTGSPPGWLNWPTGPSFFRLASYTQGPVNGRYMTFFAAYGISGSGSQSGGVYWQDGYFSFKPISALPTLMMSGMGF